MERLLLLTLTLLTTSIAGVYSQTDSPIGKWVLSSHNMESTYDSTNGEWTNKDVYKKKIEITLLFEPDGKFERRLGDEISQGSWALSQGGKRLIAAAADWEYDEKWSEVINFESPLFFTEELPNQFHSAYDSLYVANDSSYIVHDTLQMASTDLTMVGGDVTINTGQITSDTFYIRRDPLLVVSDSLYKGGESKYIRVSGEKPDFDTDFVAGTWQATHLQIKKQKLKYPIKRTIEFQADGTCVERNKPGKWKINGSKLTIDIDDYGNSVLPPITDIIYELSETEFVFSRTDGDKKITVYWKKLE